MPLPPGLDQAGFDDALAEFRQVVGEDWVFVNEDHINTYRDDFSPQIDTPEEPIPSAAVAPDSVEKVQAAMRIVNAYRIPIWIISSGKNYGYGGPQSRVPGSVILDLNRMNRILEINEEHAFALVEPGVSQYDLWMEIRRRGLKLWIDGPSPAYSSIIANTIEHGVGYGLYGDRMNAMCGMEVVLPQGEVLRTGMGAMSRAETWQQYKYGLGPVVDGLFTQSSLGVVTKMGIWLIPEPPAFRSAEVYVPNHEDVIPMIDTLRPLRIANVVSNSASASPNRGGHVEGGQGPGGGVPGFGGDGPPGWRCRLGFYGYDRVVETNWEQVRDEFAAAIAGATFHSERYTAPYEPDGWLTEAKLAAGIPSFQETGIWNHGGTFASMVVPCDGASYWEFLQFVDGVFRDYGLRHMGGPLHFHTPRALVALVGAPLNRADPAFNARTMEMVRRLISAGSERGYGEYRTPVVFMDEAARAYDFNDNALLRFNERLKDLLDPNGVIAPGKNGVWPAALRGDDA